MIYIDELILLVHRQIGPELKSHCQTYKSLKSAPNTSLDRHIVMNTTDINTNEEIYVQFGYIGFSFLLDNSLDYNLINPQVLTFFESPLRKEPDISEGVFSLGDILPGTSERAQIFHSINRELCKCYDHKIRNCGKIKCNILIGGRDTRMEFYVDKSLKEYGILGVIGNNLYHISNK